MKENKKKWVMSLFKEDIEDMPPTPKKNKNNLKKDYFLKLFRQ
ncbi:hypothetical protein [Aquimarina sp. 2304DJ70-9]